MNDSEFLKNVGIGVIFTTILAMLFFGFPNGIFVAVKSCLIFSVAFVCVTFIVGGVIYTFELRDHYSEKQLRNMFTFLSWIGSVVMFLALFFNDITKSYPLDTHLLSMMLEYVRNFSL